MQLGHSELTAVSEALRELYAHTDAPSLPHCIVRLLHRLIPANSAVYKRDGRDFSKRDKDVLTFLQPHIIQAFKNASDLTALKTRSTGIEGAANLCNIGAVWLSQTDQVEWMSNRAESWLRDYFPEEAPVSPSRRSQLPVRVAAWIGKQKALQQANDSLGWRAEQIISSLRGQLNIRWVSEEPNRSYLILSEQRAGCAPEELLSLGLSAREAEVLHWVAEGKDNEEVSILLAISKRTVEKHMERILAKLGVETRVEAVVRAVQCRRS